MEKFQYKSNFSNFPALSKDKASKEQFQGLVEYREALVILHQKIALLKDNIDPNLKEDPLVRLKKDNLNKKHKFSIKCTDEKSLNTIFKKMKKKKCWM